MSNKNYAARVHRMNPIDDDFLRKMAEDKSFCEEVLRTILEESTLTVTDVKSQDPIKNLQGRSVILDIHCVDFKGRHLNMELLDACVIYITQNDFLKKGKKHTMWTG